MARVVGRARRREGRGIGEFLAESFIYIVIAAVVAFAGYRYFFVYQRSPQAALLNYLGNAKAGKVDAQYALLTQNTKSQFKSKDDYDDKWPLAHGLSGRMIDYKVEKLTEMGDKAEADVTISIRKPGQELYQTGADNASDHYVLRKDAEGWKVDLVASNIKSKNFASIR